MIKNKKLFFKTFQIFKQIFKNNYIIIRND